MTVRKKRVTAETAGVAILVFIGAIFALEQTWNDGLAVILHQPRISFVTAFWLLGALVIAHYVFSGKSES